MTPIKFEKQTGIMDRAECEPMPVYNNGTTCISRWQGTWRERAQFLITGRVWLGVRVKTGGIWISADQPFDELP